LFYLAAIFADFIVPYTLSTRFNRYIYMPPQQIHFFDEGKFQPFVYDAKLTIDENLRKNYTPDLTKKFPIQFFAHGEPYKLWGIFETDVHLFSVPKGGAVCLLGTDRQGRDMFSRILLGSQVSLSIGLVGVLLSLILGSFLGIVSGYYGGWVDNLLQRLIELVRSFPSVPLWMAMSAAIPTNWSVLQTYFAISVILSLIGWTWLARQLRGKVLALRGEDFVLAAKLAGASDGWVIFKHLVPATLGHIVVVSTLAMPSMILAETALSFLGLGLRPPVTSWGVLIQEVQNFQSIALSPWLFAPALFIVVAILAFNYLGDGLRDAVDPYTI
jgi:peptide/nickel transport system permease protein